MLCEGELWSLSLTPGVSVHVNISLIVDMSIENIWLWRSIFNLSLHSDRFFKKRLKALSAFQRQSNERWCCRVFSQIIRALGPSTLALHSHRKAPFVSCPCRSPLLWRGSKSQIYALENKQLKWRMWLCWGELGSSTVLLIVSACRTLFFFSKFPLLIDSRMRRTSLFPPQSLNLEMKYAFKGRRARNC